MMRQLLVLAFALLLTSCGTLFNGSTQTVSFSSDPAGATVLVNGMPLGKTPMQSTLPGDQTQTVEFRLDGYEPRVVVLNSSLEAVWLILDIVPGFIFWFIPIVVDAATGDWKGLDQSNVHASLTKVGAKQ